MELVLTVSLRDIQRKTPDEKQTAITSSVTGWVCLTRLIERKQVHTVKAVECGNDTAGIIREIPLPMPRSWICSPSHMLKKPGRQCKVRSKTKTSPRIERFRHRNGWIFEPHAMKKTE
jgi:hypothetical protein